MFGFEEKKIFPREKGPITKTRHNESEKYR